MDSSCVRPWNDKRNFTVTHYFVVFDVYAAPDVALSALVARAEQGKDVQEKVDEVQVQLRRAPDGRAHVAVLQLHLHPTQSKFRKDILDSPQ